MASKRKLQVFVSSTYEDLKTERQAAVGAILKIGHIPAGMELFTAGDQSQMNIIQRWIDESDVYMLILGGRYGSIEVTSGIGYTELEYDYAAMQGKPLFAVVVTDAAMEERVKVRGVSCLELKNPDKLAQFRAKVLSNMSSFFVDEKDIALAVYESLSELSLSRDLKGWVSADEVGDSVLLQKEVNLLRLSNTELKRQVEELQRLKNPRNDGDAPADLEKVLSSIEVPVPDNISNSKDFKNNLLNLFYAGRQQFTLGITNSARMTDYARFLYFNVGPKLHIHGLVETEKVAGASVRRMFATKLGIQLLASMDRKIALGQMSFKSIKERNTNELQDDEGT